MKSKYIHVQSLQVTPRDANTISAHLFGFHCTSHDTVDYYESIGYHFLCARRTKENHDTINKKYGVYGIEEHELEKHVRKKLIFKFVRKYYGKYKVKKVQRTSDNDFTTKNIYLREDIFSEYNVSIKRTKIDNEYRLLSQSLYNKIADNAKSVFYSKQTQTSLEKLIPNDNDVNLNIMTGYLYDAFINKLDWVNMYLPNANTNFTIKPNSKMTMLEKNKNTYINENNNWSPKNRIEIKYGKGLRRIMEFIAETYNGDETWTEIIKTDSFIEQYVNKLKAIYNPTIKIKHVKGSDIKYWYNGIRYAENAGSLNKSCMRGRCEQDYFDIYTENPDKVEMIIALNSDDKLIGRAILWRLDNANDSDNVMFMDRIYGSDIVIEKFKQYAKQNMYWYKYEQTYNSSKVYAPDGTVEEADFYVKLKNTDNELFPYMDTMQEASDVYANYITLYSAGQIDGDYLLTSTDGKWDDYNNNEDVYIERYGEYYHEDDVIYSEVYNENIISDRSRETYDGDYVWDDDEDYVEASDTEAIHHIDDLGYSDYDGYYYKDYVECYINGIIGYSESMTIELENEEYIVHSDVSEEELAETLGIEIKEYE